MTRKDYIVIAEMVIEICKAAQSNTLKYVLIKVAVKHLARNYANFREDRFKDFVEKGLEE
jgi:hypothetical protein